MALAHARFVDNISDFTSITISKASTVVHFGPGFVLDTFACVLPDYTRPTRVIFTIVLQRCEERTAELLFQYVRLVALPVTIAAVVVFVRRKNRHVITVIQFKKRRLRAIGLIGLKIIWQHILMLRKVAF